MAEDASGGSLGLQFDTALPRDGSGTNASGVVTCHACQRTLHTEYFDVSGHTTCDGCRSNIDALLQTPRGISPLLKAGIFGTVAGIFGAAIYYAVIAIANLEVGIVAILIGYMVGYAVRKGAGGRGGRRFQVLAVVLTYSAVALAYAPMAVQGALSDSHKDETSVSTSEAQKAPTLEENATSPSASKLVMFVLLFAGFIFVLPVLVIAGSLPSGLISAAIIFFGMQQAWKMTGRPALQITGPYRVGVAPPVVTA
jgi:hypothetical protein